MPINSDVSPNKQEPTALEVNVTLTPLLKQLGYSEDQMKNLDSSTIAKIMREYPTPAKRGDDGKFYVTPSVEDRVYSDESKDFNIISSSQNISRDGTTIQNYSMSGSGSGKACLIIAIWDYWQNEVYEKLPQGDYDQYYEHVANCWRYDYWHSLTNGEATHYNIWGWITWACAEYETVDVIMTGHGCVWIWEWGACSAFGSWDTQCGIYGVLYYWNLFIPQDITYHWLYNPYSYDALKMGNFHFCNSWGGSWFYGFEPIFCGDYSRTHSSAFMGFSDIGYTSADFAREWSEKWLYWDYDSWTAYSDSLWAQDHQWDYPLWYNDYGGTIYA